MGRQTDAPLTRFLSQASKLALQKGGEKNPLFRTCFRLRKKEMMFLRVHSKHEKGEKEGAEKKVQGKKKKNLEGPEKFAVPGPNPCNKKREHCSFYCSR